MSGDPDEPVTLQARTEAPASGQARTLAGRYDIRSLLGAGAVGTVYRAYDRELDEDVALKVLREHPYDATLLVELLRREVKLARRIAHPNVARVFDLGESEGTRFLTMEYIAGPSLGRVLSKECRLSIQRGLEIARALCAGLDAAHHAGVLHLDLKPDNVLLDELGRVAITDFGLARSLQRSSSTLRDAKLEGSPAYMAPEQIDSPGDLDPRADIFALGVLLFETMTGELPFYGETPLAMAAARLTTPPRDPRALRADLPDAVAQSILRCLARNRSDRYVSAAELAACLGRLTPPQQTSFVDEATVESSTFATLPAATKSLAVLAFRHADSDEDARVADGLCDDLVDSLSRIDGLHVRARSVLASLRNVDPIEIGKRLSVDAVVDGSVRRTDAGIKVSARVLTVAGAFPLWSDKFEGPACDLFALTDRVVAGVASSLGVATTASPRGQVDGRAMELYLHARQLLSSVDVNGPAQAAALLAQALERAPRDATLLASAARANVRAWFFGGQGAEVAREAGYRAATRAIELAPHLAEARHALATWYLNDGQPARAVLELRHVLHHSDFLPAYETFGAILNEAGLLSEARHYLDLALAIEPTSASAIHELARLEAFAGRWSLADSWLDRLTLVLGDQEDASRERAGLMRGRFCFWRGGGAAEAEKLGSTGFGPLSASVLRAWKGQLDPVSARAAFEHAAAGAGSARRKALLHQLSCETACFQRQAEWAVDALGRAVHAGLVDVSWLRHCPLLEVVRAIPGWELRAAPVELRAQQVAHALRAR